MIVLIGYYTCVSLTMNFYTVPASGGDTPRHELAGRSACAGRSGWTSGQKCGTNLLLHLRFVARPVTRHLSSRYKPMVAGTAPDD
jgi:hypothetical protein